MIMIAVFAGLFSANISSDDTLISSKSATRGGDLAGRDVDSKGRPHVY